MTYFVEKLSYFVNLFSFGHFEFLELIFKNSEIYSKMSIDESRWISEFSRLRRVSKKFSVELQKRTSQQFRNFCRSERGDFTMIRIELPVELPKFTDWVTDAK